MPNLSKRSLGLAGMADIGEDPSTQGQKWLDSDRARISGPAGSLSSWPGWKRTGKIFNMDALGTAGGDFIQIIVGGQNIIKKNTGHVLAALDRSANTNGRVLGITHHTGGRLGTEMVGKPLNTVADALHDLTSGGSFTGNIPAIWQVKISTAGTPDAFVWSKDNGATFSAPVTVIAGWIALDEGVKVKFGATTGHTINAVWLISIGGRVWEAARLNRMTPHDYIEFAGVRGSTLISTPWDEMYVDDGATVRRAGLRAPHIPPVAQSGLPAPPSTTDIADTDNASVSWTASRGGVTTSTETTDPEAADSGNYLKILINESQRAITGNLAYVDASGTVPGSSRIRMKLRLKGPLRDNVSKKAWAFVLASGTALNGDTVEIPIRYITGTKNWVSIDLLFPNSTPFTYASMGFKMVGTFTSGFFPDPGMGLLVNHLTLESVTVPSPMLASGGNTAKYFFMFTWLNSATGRQSAPSPYSQEISLGGSAGNLELDGFQAGMDAGLINSPPPDADAVHLYVSSSEWDRDPRTTGLSFFRVTPPSGIPIASLGAGLVYQVTNEKAAEFLNAPDGPRHPFFNGLPRAGSIAVADGNLIVTAALPGFSVGKWTVTFDSHVITPVVSDAANTPIVAVWMEGRKIQVEGDGEIYTILKALDQDADGVLDALWIGKNFDGDAQMFQTAFQGVSGARKAIIQPDERTLYWTNNTEELGVDPEASSVANQLELMPNGDKIITIGKAGEFLYVIGSDNLYILNQNVAALADLPGDTGVAYSSPIHLPGIGCAARRTFVSRSGGTAMWLGPHGEIYEASGTKVTRHPASDSLASLFAGVGGVITPEALRHAWGEIASDGKEEGYFLNFPSMAFAEAFPTEGVAEVSTAR